MTITTTALNTFVEGSNYPSPVTHVIGLGYYDGVTSGVLRAADGTVYAFDMIGEVTNSDDAEDRRRFELKPLPSDSFDNIISALAPYHKPAWPVWVPLWTFPNAESQAAVDEVIRAELRRAGPPAWAIEATDIAHEIVTASKAGESLQADYQQHYCKLLLVLVELERAGRPQAGQSDHVRNEMRATWSRLNPNQRLRLAGLAEDLKQLSRGGPKIVEMSASELQAYREKMSSAWDQHKAGDHDAALVALRNQHPKGVGTRSGILFLQARAWLELALPEAALAFFKAAEQDDPSLCVFTLLVLRELGRTEEAVAYSERILREQPNDIHACFQACATTARPAKQDKQDRALKRFAEVVPHLQRLRKCIERMPSGEPDLVGLGVGVGCLLGLVQEELGEFKAAHAAYSWVIQHYPQDPDAWAMRGVLLFFRNQSRAALADFHEAITRRSRSAIPYVFVARTLLATSAPEALQVVNQAERQIGAFEGAVGAALYEVRALAKLALKQSLGRVVEDLDHAIRLVPDNLQLRQNRDAIASAALPVAQLTIPLELLRMERQRVLRERPFKAGYQREMASTAFLKQSA